MVKHFPRSREILKGELMAVADQVPDDMLLDMLPGLLHRFSGHYAYDRAVNAIEEIREEIEPFDMAQPLPRVAACRELDPAIWGSQK